MVKVTAKTPKRRHWRRHDVFNGNWTYLTSGSSVSVVNFEHVIADWELSSCIFSRIIEWLEKSNTRINTRHSKANRLNKNLSNVRH